MTGANITLILAALSSINTHVSNTSNTEDVIKIPKECYKPGFCAIKPKGYENMEEAMNKLLTKILGKTLPENRLKSEEIQKGQRILRLTPKFKEQKGTFLDKIVDNKGDNTTTNPYISE